MQEPVVTRTFKLYLTVLAAALSAPDAGGWTPACGVGRVGSGGY